MNRLVTFDLVTEVTTKDKTGQTKTIKTFVPVIGKQNSVYQNEFFKSEQAGVRSQGVIEVSYFDYNGQKLLRLNDKIYSIYRTYEQGTDRVELYYGERVGLDG